MLVTVYKCKNCGKKWVAKNGPLCCPYCRNKNREEIYTGYAIPMLNALLNKEELPKEE